MSTLIVNLQTVKTMPRPIKVICCVCTKQQESDGWKRKPVSHQHDYSHGYCPECYEVAMAEVNQYIKERGESYG